MAELATVTSEGRTCSPCNILASLDINECTQAEFCDILTNLDEIYAYYSTEQRTKFVEKVHRRMIDMISQKIDIPIDRIVAVIRKLIIHNPVMTILTIDELKDMNVKMEKRSVIIHFDMSGSMATSGFIPLVNTIKNLCNQLQNQGVETFVSLFGGSTQEGIHAALGGRLLTTAEFTRGNYQPTGGTAFCPSFERTKLFPAAFDAIIISDGDFTDNVSHLAFQEHCETVFFVAPPWSPVGIEEKHARTISPCVKPNVSYIGISSDRYPELDVIIEGFLREHNTFARLTGFVAIGNYTVPSSILAPTRIRQIFNNAAEQGEVQLQALAKKIIGLFRYLEETARISFERCIQGEAFRNLMSLVTPLIRSSEAHLEASTACQQLYGYLEKIMNTFSTEKKKLMKTYAHDPKVNAEVQKFWDDAMTYSERDFIVEESTRRYGQPIGFLNVHVDQLTCTGEMLSDALQQLRRLYALETPDCLSLFFNLISMSTVDENRTSGPEESTILVWKKSNGTVDIMSILRQIPLCLVQYQYVKRIAQDRPWTLQPLAAIRLAWIMTVSNRPFPDFILQSLPALIKSNNFLTNLDQDENRGVFWIKIIRELAPKIELSAENLQLIDQILTVHGIRNFLMKLYERTFTYETPLYGAALPFLDTDEPMAWCIFINTIGEFVNPRTGEVTHKATFISNPREVERWYAANLSYRGALVRPRYLSLIDHPNLPDGAIELYESLNTKDTDVLRAQLSELYGSSYSVDQINAHIHTIRDQLKRIPRVVWGSIDSIRETVISAKEACKDAPIIMEKVIVDINRARVMNYLIAHCDNRFIAGALSGFDNYSKMIKQTGDTTIYKFDYAIECGQKAILEPTTPIPYVKSQYWSQPIIEEYLKRKYRQLMKSIDLMSKPPQFLTLTELVQKAQPTTTANISSLAESVTQTAPQTQLNEKLFTCPITLDIMENPAVTAPCGHMFEMDAIVSYLLTANDICPVCRTKVTDVTQSLPFKTVIEAWISNPDQ